MKRAEHTRLRRREMLAAYYETLLDEGLQGASLAKIAKRLDVPPSLLIHYFGTKQQMTIELVHYLLEVFYEAYGDELGSIPDPVERLHAILDTFFSVEYHQLLDDRAYYALFYLSLTRPDVRAAYADLLSGELDLVETAIRESMAAGAVSDGDPHELALTIKALEEGYAFLIGGGSDEAEKTLLGDVIKARAERLLGLS